MIHVGVAVDLFPKAKENKARVDVRRFPTQATGQE